MIPDLNDDKQLIALAKKHFNGKLYLQVFFQDFSDYQTQKPTEDLKAMKK